jgi:MATE family multidrug resistance protein
LDIGLIRQIAGLAWPVLIAQLAYMGVAVADTVLAGRYGTTDLAGVAIASSLYITVSLSCAGVIQSIAPTVAHLHGAGRAEAIGSAARQGAWLALLLGACAAAILAFPRPLLTWSAPSAEVEAIAVGYLQAAAWGIPAQLLYRAFYAFSAALGRPRPFMVISTLGACLDVPLAWALIYGKLAWPPLGGVGCAVAASITAWCCCLAASLWLALDAGFARYGVLARWEPPDRRQLLALVRIGLPMGFSNLVEISAFTFIALFVASLGADVVSGHRIATNLVALCFMLPLSLGNALVVLVGQAVGARDFDRARAVAANGAGLATALAILLALALYFASASIVGAYTTDPAVRAVALTLVGWAALMHVFDATQTICSFALRGFKVTFGPMLIHVAAFWGVGLAGGWWLAFRASPALGVEGFWISTVASLAAATALVGALLVWIARRFGR